MAVATEAQQVKGQAVGGVHDLHDGRKVLYKTYIKSVKDIYVHKNKAFA